MYLENSESEILLKLLSFINEKVFGYSNSLNVTILFQDSQFKHTFSLTLKDDI